MRSIGAATLRVFALACIIEVLQLLVFTRFSDVSDILIGTLGGLAGAAIAGPLMGRFAVADRTLSDRVRRNIACAILLVYCVPLAAEYWTPMELVASPAEFTAELQNLAGVPFAAYYRGTEFAALTNLLKGFLLFLPVGGVIRWAMPGRSAGVSLAWSAGVGVALGLIVEVGQASLVERVADNTDVVMYALGACAGWAACHLVLRSDESAAPHDDAVPFSSRPPDVKLRP